MVAKLLTLSSSPPKSNIRVISSIGVSTVISTWRVVREKPNEKGEYQLVTEQHAAEPVIMLREGKYILIAQFGKLWGQEKLYITAGEVEKVKVKLKAIDGLPPNLIGEQRGCPFVPRCTYATDKCRRENPPLAEVEANHAVACWNHLLR